MASNGQLDLTVPSPCSKSPISNTPISSTSTSSSCGPHSSTPPPTSLSPSHLYSSDCMGKICSVPMLPIYQGPMVDPDTLPIYNHPRAELLSSSPPCSSRSDAIAPKASRPSTSRRVSLINKSRRSLRSFASTVKRRLRLSLSRSQMTETSNSKNQRVGQQGLMRSRRHSAAPRSVTGHSARRRREVRDANGNAVTKHVTYNSNVGDCEKTESF